MRHSAYNLNRVTIYSRKSKKYLEILGVTGKFGLGVQNEAGQKLIEFCQENALVITSTLFQQHKTLHMGITIWSIPKSD